MTSLFYRALLSLLPRRFTRRDRMEMWYAHRERVAEAARRGRLALARAGAAEVADLAVAVGRERLSGSLDTLAQDVRMGIRSFLRAPLISALAVLSLALGIGATSAIFSALDVWLWRPLPVPNQDRLVRVSMANREMGWSGNALTLRDFVDLRAGARRIDLAAYRQWGVNLATEGEADRVIALQGSANLLPVLGVEPALGRGFRPEEERQGSARVVLLTDAFWRTRWGADPTVLGNSLLLDGEPHTIIGVLPPRSTLPNMEADVWVPMRLTGDEPRTNHLWFALGVPTEGAELAAVGRDLDRVAAGIAQRDPTTYFPDVDVQLLRDFIHTGAFRHGSFVLGAAALFVLLIACANIANLLLARGVGRRHEVAVRHALGAGRARVVRQLLTENAMLALLGGAAGVGVARVALRLLVDVVFPPGEVPGVGYMSLDGRVLVATAVLTTASALVFGLMPSLSTSRVDLRARLVEGGRGSTGAGRGGLAKVLVVGEITMAVALLATTGLVIRSLASMHRVDMGFRTDDALTFAVSLPASSYPDEADVRAFHARLTHRIEAIPGVAGVGASTAPPIGGYSSTLYAVDSDAPGDDRKRSAWARKASADYVRVMGMRMAAGRWFDDALDPPGGARVAVVSRSLARREWGAGTSALGRVLSTDSDYEVVGVVDVGRLMGPQRPPPSVIFLSATQLPSRSLYYVVDATTDRAAAVAAIRDQVRQLDPWLAVFDVSTLEQEFRKTLEPEVVVIEIVGTLGALALVLTLMGVYGVLAHSVGRRSRELGVRAALGADAAILLRLVMSQSGRLTALGVVAGLVIAVALGRLLSAVLADVHPFDVNVLAGSAVVMIAAAGLASWLPARRAARVDPVRALQDG